MGKLELKIKQEKKKRFNLIISSDGDNHQDTKLSDKNIHEIQKVGYEVLNVVSKIIIEDIDKVFNNDTMLNEKGKNSLKKAKREQELKQEDSDDNRKPAKTNQAIFSSNPFSIISPEEEDRRTQEEEEIR